MVEVILAVEGMKCAMCESHVCDQLRKVEGVKKAKANARKGEARAIAEGGVDTSAMKELVEAQGYIVTSLRISPYEKKSLFGLRKAK